MHNKKKKFVLKRFTPYMGKKKVLLPLSLVLSGLSAVLNIVPFVLVWYITRDILSAPQAIDVSNVGTYAWLAFASAHRRRRGVLWRADELTSRGLPRGGRAAESRHAKNYVHAAGGFSTNDSSGKMRKIVNDGAGTTPHFFGTPVAGYGRHRRFPHYINRTDLNG